MGKYTLVGKGPLGIMLREHVELRASNEFGRRRLPVICPTLMALSLLRR